MLVTPTIFKTNRRLLRLLLRYQHKLKKPIDEKPSSPISQEVKNYLESSEDYKEILDKIPKHLLKKYKAPETMYLINKKTAAQIVSNINNKIEKNSPIVEVNPGFGYLTKELLSAHNNNLFLYEVSNHFTKGLEEIQASHPERVSFKLDDFFGMWKLAFQDKMDDGNRISDLLGDLATDDKDRKLSIVGAMPSLSFVKHLINTIVFHNTTSQLGKPDLFIVMPGQHYEFLTDATIQLSKHKSVPALFQLLFDFTVLDKVPKVHFLPWTHSTATKKSNVIDENCMYLVNIKLKDTLPCPPHHLPLLWYFFKPHTFSNSTRVIPKLEQWIPGCGVRLITGQEPPADLTPAPAPLPHMNIFTQFSDLTLHHKLTVFRRFVSWPEFEQCGFRSAMENSLPKFATQLDDERAPHLDDVDEELDDV
ncbi:dimethyladenosine transferase 2, mitochondrial [Aricia agestis]|uniref:dimethyladenosine transferase 2, mitochondrial n=1 Tax=Aricia agestis TaxID=91739 RepID=UPI001C205FAB|nr:dimethyladenosine transferase 2, mitochondrial [Aricia agestis]